jgi:Transposase DDE domain
MHFALLSWLARYGDIDWSRAIVDSCSVRAVCGGAQTGPNPTDRAKCGSKRHLICDGKGVPLAVRLTGANRNDSQEALALVDAIPPLHVERGRPRQRPDCVLGDRGYDAAAIRLGSGPVTSRPYWPCAAPRTGVDWVDGGGSSSERLRGLTSSVGSASATTSGPTSTGRSSRWAALSFVGSRCERRG